MLDFIAIVQQSLKSLLFFFFFVYFIFDLVICDSTKYPVCNLEPSEPARHCLDYEITIKTKKDKQDILDKINSRRDKVASGDIRSLPSAGNMVKMQWNENLEISAQRWANQCLPYKQLDTKGICSLSDNVHIGQNIATIVGDSPGLSPAILVDVWYMELLNMNSTFVSRYRPSNQTHLRHYDYFTQLVWAQSYQVGCGGIKFKEINDKNERNQTINRLVCNFIPAGNQVEKPVYTDGFPCSECPYTGICDSVYSSLCTLDFKMNDKTITDNEKAIGIIRNLPSVNSYKNNHEQENSSTNYLKNTPIIDLEIDDNITSFDYFANLFHSVVSTEKITTKRIITCKDIMPVEDFIELFKKRLLKDQELKEFLFKTKPAEYKENSDSSFTDPSVANFMSQIHSKKVISTTAQPTEPDYSNSTLLADLVEAVILKNNDDTSTPETEEKNTNIIADVSAVKIKAEFGKIQTNSFSTGHYFFPVEYDEEDSKQITEFAYDMSSIAISDIALEIEELKRNKGTKDFLEEILESESSPEPVSRIVLPSPTYYLNENGSEDLLEYSTKTIEKKTLHREKRSEVIKTGLLLRRFKKKKSDFTTRVIYYRDLLKKIAYDIGILKLNERFHCAGKSALLSPIKLKLLIFCYVLAFNLKYELNVCIGN